MTSTIPPPATPRPHSLPPTSAHPILHLLKSIQFQATKEVHYKTLTSAVEHATEGPRDLVIISSENEEIPANRFPLSILSPMLLSATSSCCSTPTLFLPDCSSSSIKNLLSLITRGFTVLDQVSYTETNNILETARILNIDMRSLGNVKLLHEPSKKPEQEEEPNSSLKLNYTAESASILSDNSNPYDSLSSTPQLPPRMSFSSLSVRYPAPAATPFKRTTSRNNSLGIKRRNNSFVIKRGYAFTPKRRASFKSLALKGIKSKNHLLDTSQTKALDEPQPVEKPVEMLPAPLELMTLFELREWLIPQLKADLAEQGKGNVAKIKWGNKKYRPLCWDESFPWQWVRNPKKLQTKIPQGVHFISVLKQTVRNRLAMKHIDPSTHISKEKNNQQICREKGNLLESFLSSKKT